ncbi:MAG: VWA domain-containing protein, partial [Deltaproteobacteria bacterium]|nr:VWA domain-containing protein [Deltaproteobacteria bacterium]
LLPLLLLTLLWWKRRTSVASNWQTLCDAQLLPHILIGNQNDKATGPDHSQSWHRGLILTAGILAIVALAGPTWQRQPQPLFKQQSALVILLDLSQSMLAADLKPSRLVQARLKLTDLLRQRREGQTALIVFAAEPFTVVPLTDDTKTIIALLGSLDPTMMPAQGSDLKQAIALGEQLLKQGSQPQGTLLLITDEDTWRTNPATTGGLHKRSQRTDGSAAPRRESPARTRSSGRRPLPPASD